ncbi:MAG TPA: class II glutamine amidotransferase [Beijerinckiaceae bacterium]|nr:class II glutamine amidotransferase [Beijerinckiaceae bacterium]
MCRWIAYRGRPVYLETVIVQPAHSLVHQSLHATESKTGTNGDGFGVGWYGEKPDPGLYREVRPAWSDENLRSLCAQVRSPLFFAHVRASTGTATSRANCHPFVHGQWMFMHNGQIGCFQHLRRRVEELIPDDLYTGRSGSTDSEAIFLAAMARMASHDPVAAIASVLGDVKAMMQRCCVAEPLRFTAALTNGRDIYAFRWACDDKAPTLYWRIKPKGLFIVSEPFDNERQNWNAMPQASVLVARAGEDVAVAPLDLGVRLAA